MTDKRYIVHGHVNRVTGTTQKEINAELTKFFMDVQPEHPLYDELKVEQWEINKGIIVINNNTNDPSIYIKNTEGDVVKISGNGSKTVTKYEEAVSEASSDNIGQIIYVKEKSVCNNETYDLGPYIVIGPNELMKLSTTLASGNVETAIAELQLDVNALSEALDDKVTSKDGYSLISNENIEKLNNIEEGAQVNTIEKIIVNGEEVPIVGKTVAFTVSVSDVDGRVDNAKVEEIDGVKYLVLEFTESANKEDILVPVSEMFTEQYTPGNAITLENQVIALKLGANESILEFGADGGLTISEVFVSKISDIENTISNHSEAIENLSDSVTGLNMTINGLKVLEVSNYASALQQATDKNIGQVIKTKKDSLYSPNEDTEEKLYLEGFYIVKGVKELDFIVTGDGTKDEIENVIQLLNEQHQEFTEKINLIDNYTVNAQPISQEGGVILGGSDINLNEGLGSPDYIMDSVREGDSINLSVRKLENSLAATVIAMTASLNDMNSQINWVVDETQPTDGVLMLKPNRLHIIEEPVSNITFNGEGEYGYAVLMKTSDVIESIVLPQNIILSNLTIDEVESNTNYLLEMKYNFVRWTKLKTL